MSFEHTPGPSSAYAYLNSLPPVPLLLQELLHTVRLNHSRTSRQRHRANIIVVLVAVVPPSVL